MGPLAALRHLFGRTAPASSPMLRSYDAARPAARRGLGHFGAINGEVAAAAGTVRSRSRHATANQPLLALGLDNLQVALIGSGPRPTGDPAAMARWADWERREGFLAKLALMVGGMIRDGEALAVLQGDRWRLLAIEQLSDTSRPLGNGREIVTGVELDAEGDAVAYWIHPGRHESGDWRPAVQVDAADVLHLFRPTSPTQLRGMPWFAPAIVAANEFDQLADALLVRAKVSAMLCGFIRSVDGPALDVESELPSLEPGTLARLGAGEDFVGNNPTPSVENGALAAVMIRTIAAGCGLPPHLLDQDLSGANYSSLRAGLLPFRAKVEQIQYAVIAPMLDRLWQRVTGAEPCEWLFPAFMQVDPLKQVQADAAELKAGLTSRRKLVAARGWDLAELDAELVAEGWKSPAEHSAEATEAEPKDPADE